MLSVALVCDELNCFSWRVTVKGNYYTSRLVGWGVEAVCLHKSVYVLRGSLVQKPPFAINSN